eukprot:403362310
MQLLQKAQQETSENLIVYFTDFPWFLGRKYSIESNLKLIIEKSKIQILAIRTQSSKKSQRYSQNKTKVYLNASMPQKQCSHDRSIKERMSQIKAQLKNMIQDIAVGFLDHILKDQKIKDSAISDKVETQCSSYSVKDFWGMPKVLQTAFKMINQYNINKEVGFEFYIKDSNENEEQSDLQINKTEEDSTFDYFKEFVPPDNLCLSQVEISQELLTSIKDEIPNQASNQFSQQSTTNESTLYVRNFDLVLQTVFSYSNLFTEEEKCKIKLFLAQDGKAKTIYARMFFRRRYWFNKQILSKYSQNQEYLEDTAQNLYRNGFLRSDEDVIYEGDFERINELIENGINVCGLKILETELKKIIRGNHFQELEQDFDLIRVNTFYQQKQTFEGKYGPVCEKLSAKISKWIREISEENIINGKKVLFFRDNAQTEKLKICLRLFFFYQKKDAYETLLDHDYGFYRYESFKNYLSNRESDPNNDNLKPIFQCREDFLAFDEASQVIGSTFEFLQMGLKRRDMEAKVAKKIIKQALRMCEIEFNKNDQDFLLFNNIKQLIEDQQEEKNKCYALSSITLICLLQNKIFYTQRGKWWHRLAMNLKHIKQKNEALKCCDIAIKDEFVKGDKRNMILKLRLNLFVEINRQNGKILIKNSKALAKKNQKGKKKGKGSKKNANIEMMEDFNKSFLKSQQMVKDTKRKFNRISMLNNFLDDEEEAQNGYSRSKPFVLDDYSDDEEQLNKKLVGKKRKKKYTDQYDEESNIQSSVEENSDTELEDYKSKLLFQNTLDQKKSELRDLTLEYKNSESINGNIEYDPILNPDAIIENEKRMTFELLSRSVEQKIDKRYFKEVILNAKRNFQGDHMKSVYLDKKSNQFFNVENLALHYYGQKLRWNGAHVENALMKYMYGIMMWDEIFNDNIPYVFQTPYQFQPLDFDYPEFYYHRKDIIEQKLNRIIGMTRMQIKEYLISEYDKHKNFHNPIVNWDNIKLTKQRMGSIAYCMGGPLIAMFFKKLAQDFQNWCYGMPDLVLWREHKGEIKFVEVKSENDTLSEQQKCWILNITECGVEVDLCWVTDKIDGVDVF